MQVQPPPLFTLSVTMVVGAGDARVVDPNDANYEYQIVRFKKGRLDQSLGTSYDTGNALRTQVDDIVWRALTGKYSQLPVDQIVSLDAFITANYKP